MVKPQQIVREIVDFVGGRGVIAGGAVRDIILGRIPKDYDVFIFEEGWFDEITDEVGIFDYLPEETSTITRPYGYFWVYNTTLHSQPVQIIYSPDFLEFSDGKDIDGEDIVRRFPFAVNMAYVAHNHKIVVRPEAEEAFNRKQIIFNPKHCTTRHSQPQAYVAHMFKRAFYLADKLNFTIPQATLDAICEGQDHIDELDNRTWTEESTNALSL